MLNYPKLDWKTRLLDRILKLNRGKPLEEMNQGELRQFSEQELSPLIERVFGGKLIELHQVVDRTVSGRHGDIPIRIYSPSAKTNLPIVLYMHGGGWVFGNLQTCDRLCRRVAKDTGAIVVSVDYRLAPFFKYPTAIEDCYDVFLWMTQNLSDLNANPDEIMVMGDSAGGNLATVLCLMVRDSPVHLRKTKVPAGDRCSKRQAIAKQILIYPVTSGELNRASVAKNADAPVLTKDRMQFFIDCYACEPEDIKNPYFSPLFAEDLSNLPPALIITSEYDVLHDQGVEYVQKLQEAGNRVEPINYSGAIHGFISFPVFCNQALPAFQKITKFIAN